MNPPASTPTDRRIQYRSDTGNPAPVPNDQRFRACPWARSGPSIVRDSLARNCLHIIRNAVAAQSGARNDCTTSCQGFISTVFISG